jgi:hypothetical protein
MLIDLNDLTRLVQEGGIIHLEKAPKQVTDENHPSRSTTMEPKKIIVILIKIICQEVNSSHIFLQQFKIIMGLNQPKI